MTMDAVAAAAVATPVGSNSSTTLWLVSTDANDNGGSNSSTMPQLILMDDFNGCKQRQWRGLMLMDASG